MAFGDLLKLKGGNLIHTTDKDGDRQTCCGKTIKWSSVSGSKVTCKACIKEIAAKAAEGDRRYDDILYAASGMYEDRQKYWLGLISENRAVVVEEYKMKEECAGLRFSEGNVINSKSVASLEYAARKDASSIFFVCKVVVIKEYMPVKATIYKEEEGGRVNSFDIGCGHEDCSGSC